MSIVQVFFEGIKKNSFHKVQIGDSKCNTKERRKTRKPGRENGEAEERKTTPKTQL